MRSDCEFPGVEFGLVVPVVEPDTVLLEEPIRRLSSITDGNLNPICIYLRSNLKLSEGEGGKGRVAVREAIHNEP